MPSFLATLSLLLSSTALATTAARTGLIVPLYVYPISCDSWAPITSALSAHPSLPIISIINPNSGPGTGLPDPGYRQCTPKLAKGKGRVVGYIATGFGARSVANVKKDIDVYTSWGAAYRPTGIFVDEATTDGGHVKHYRTLAQYARSKGFSLIILNPGTTPAAGYYSFSNVIVTAEDYYTGSSPSSLTISASTPASKQAVILHDAPASPEDLEQVVDAVVAKGARYFYATDGLQTGNMYGSIATFFAEEAADVAST